MVVLFARGIVHISFAHHTHSSGGGSGGQAAKDALGNDIKSKAWLKTHPANDRSLAQGLKVSVGGDGAHDQSSTHVVWTHTHYRVTPPTWW